jgi:predicted ATPase
MPPVVRIKVEGFKSIRKLDLELRSLNVLIGANGSGKTNFVSLFRLLNQIVQGNLQVFVARSGGADALLHYGQKVTHDIRIELNWEDTGYRCALAPSAGDSLFFAEETCWWRESRLVEPSTFRLGGGHKESTLRLPLVARGSVIAMMVLGGLDSWRVYHFHDTGDTAGMKQLGELGDNAMLRSDASNLAAFLYLLHEKERSHYDRIVETIRLAAPFFDDFVLRPNPLNPETIKLEWKEKASDAYFDASALSDGTLRFMCLATVLLQPSPPPTVLIDEPVLGLHPYAITLLANMLQSAAAKQQVIVSTQSVPLVNQFLPEDIVVVDRENGQSVFKRLEAQRLESWLGEYGLGELWEKNVLGGRP